MKHTRPKSLLPAFLHAVLCMGTALSLVACYADKGSEAGDSLPWVSSVKGISADTYTLYQGDTLRLSPTVEFTRGADTTRYDYRWVVGRSETISEQRRLEWPVSLPKGYAMAADIPGCLVVSDRATGLEYRQTFTFQVRSNYSPSSLIVYETSDGRVEWMSMQGEPAAFTRWFDGMVRRIQPDEPINGHCTGALYSTNELAIFTDNATDGGRCISLRNADADAGFLYNVGEYTGHVVGNIYKGTSAALHVSNVVFGYGASKYLLSNGTLHVFNGLDKKLPIFDEQTFVKSRGVVQAMSSKQFQRYKKATFVLHADGHVGCYHVYNDVMENVKVDGQPLVLDSLCGCFTEATGMGSNQPYDVYLVGRHEGRYDLYQFHVDYVNRVVWPLRLVRRMTVDATLARNVRCWWGSFGENYAFYTDGHTIWRFDYYEMEAFDPSASTPIVTLPAGEELVDVFPLTPGLGLRDEDDCTVALVYNAQRGTSSVYVFDTVSGRVLRHYADIIPGRAVYFTKCF